MSLLGRSNVFQATAPDGTPLPKASFAHGPALMGIFINLMLYGIVVAQTFFYFVTYKKDKTWIKLYVGTLFLCDTLNSAFDMQWIYNILINNFDNRDALLSANWVFATDPALVGIIACMSQLFFAWRILVLTRSWYLVTLITITSLGSFFGGIGSAIAIHFVPQFDEFRKFQSIVIFWLVTAAVCDVSITMVLSWHLRRHKTGFTATDDILNRIVRIAVQNGLMTSIWAIMDLVLYMTVPTGVHLAFNLPLAKLYTNSLMSSLNSRALWSDRDRDRSHTTSGGNAMQLNKIDMVNLSTHTRPEVFVSVESHQMRDKVADGNVKVAEDEWDTHTGSNQGDIKG